MANQTILRMAGLIGLIAAAGTAYAATETVTVNLQFEQAISLTKNADVDFGVVLAGQADTYTIDTAGSVSAAGAGEALGGSPAAGDIDISGSTTQTINISVGNYVANGGVTPQNATCNYNGGGEVACTDGSMTGAAAPAAGKTLLLGVQAVVDGTQASGASAAPTFDVTVVYN